MKTEDIVPGVLIGPANTRNIYGAWTALVLYVDGDVATFVFKNSIVLDTGWKGKVRTWKLL